MLRASTANIPAGLIDLCVREQKTGALSVLVCLKAKFGAYAHSVAPEGISASLGISTRTFGRHVKWLLKRGWIGKDGKAMYLRGWDTIRRMERIQPRGAWSVPLANFKQLEATIRGALVANIVRWQSRDRVKSGRGNQRGVLSVRYLAKVLGCGNAKAHKLIKDAQATGCVRRVVKAQERPTAAAVAAMQYMDAKHIWLAGGRALEFREINPAHRFVVSMRFCRRAKYGTIQSGNRGNEAAGRPH